MSEYSSLGQTMLVARLDARLVSSGNRCRRRDLLFLSAWCGLAAGLLEVGTKVLCRAIDPSQRLYLMSHHFIWLSPAREPDLLLGIGLVSAAAIKLAPCATGWFGSPLDLRLYDTAGTDRCRTPDLRRGMVTRVTRRRRMPGS